ncbi:MAG: hypothetical protein AAF330_00070 [Pseudomonadota bacterium]
MSDARRAMLIGAVPVGCTGLVVAYYAGSLIAERLAFALILATLAFMLLYCAFQVRKRIYELAPFACGLCVGLLVLAMYVSEGGARLLPALGLALCLLSLHGWKVASRHRATGSRRPHLGRSKCKAESIVKG